MLCLVVSIIVGLIEETGLPHVV